MKVNVCDVCYKSGKLTETRTYFKVTGHKDLRVDYCPECKTKIPKPMKEYIKFAYDLHGIPVDDKFVEQMMLTLRRK
jgi:hypothetical protein